MEHKYYVPGATKRRRTPAWPMVLPMTTGYPWLVREDPPREHPLNAAVARLGEAGYVILHDAFTDPELLVVCVHAFSVPERQRK